MHPRTCLGAPDSWLRVMARSRRSIPDKVCYWEGALQLWFTKLCQKMIDHGSRSTRGPGPSRSRYYGPKNMICSTKAGLAYNFCLIKFSPSCTTEAVDVLQTPV